MGGDSPIRCSEGLGEQLNDPAHLAFPEVARFMLPAGVWHPGRNTLKISVTTGWLTWDSLALLTSHTQQ